MYLSFSFLNCGFILYKYIKHYQIRDIRTTTLFNNIWITKKIWSCLLLHVITHVMSAWWKVSLKQRESLWFGESLDIGRPRLRLYLGWTQVWPRIPPVVLAGHVTEDRLPYLMELSSLQVWIWLPSKVVWKIELSKDGNVCGYTVDGKFPVPGSWYRMSWM